MFECSASSQVTILPDSAAMATSQVGPLVLRAWVAAPVPRPPQPTRAMGMVTWHAPA